METPLEELIAGLDGLYEKATKGPWEIGSEWIFTSAECKQPADPLLGVARKMRQPDVEFIVALVNSYPRLRAHLKGRDEVIEQAAQIVEDHYWDSLAHGGIGKTHGAAIAKAIRALRNAAIAAGGGNQ